MGLGAAAGQSVSSVSYVDVLEAAGLVTTRREGRYTFHHLDTAPLREIVDRWPVPPREDDQ